MSNMEQENDTGALREGDIPDTSTGKKGKSKKKTVRYFDVQSSANEDKPGDQHENEDGDVKQDEEVGTEISGFGEKKKRSRDPADKLLAVLDRTVNKKRRRKRHINDEEILLKHVSRKLIDEELEEEDFDKRFEEAIKSGKQLVKERVQDVEEGVEELPKPLKEKYKENKELRKQKMEKFKRGKPMDSEPKGKKADRWSKNKGNREFRERLLKQEEKIMESLDLAAKTEMLLPEDAGFLEADTERNEYTFQVSQKEIQDSVDITTATKHFDLRLDYGPYTIDYYRSGRYLLMGGRKGHVAAFDWLTKDLICEFNVRESVHDVQWLHMPTLFAVAQKDWVHIYDKDGTEMHCLKKLYRVQRMEFLPYHFLLVTLSDNKQISWVDTSIGTMAASTYMKKLAPATYLTQNPNNALSVVGHNSGIVSYWSPNQPDPVAMVLCHKAKINGVAVDNQGRYMTTAANDRKIRLWDLRNKCTPLYEYKMKYVPLNVDFSQRDLLSVSGGNLVEVYRDLHLPDSPDTPYMRHRLERSHARSIQFCNFEDVLGVGHDRGFSSLIIPGAAEPNFDAFEANPYMTKKQRQEMEVKQLLEKVPAELISWDPFKIGQVSRVDPGKRLTALEKLQMLKKKGPAHPDRKVKPKNKGARGAKAREVRRETVMHRLIHDTRIEKSQTKNQSKKGDNNSNDHGSGFQKASDGPRSVLDRFKSKA